MRSGGRDENLVHFARNKAAVSVFARFDGAEHEPVRLRSEPTVGGVGQARRRVDETPFVECQVRFGYGEPDWRFAVWGRSVWCSGGVVVSGRDGKEDARGIDPVVVPAVAMEARRAPGRVPLA